MKPALSGKLEWTAAMLDEITDVDLVDRIAQIDNELALEVAQALLTQSSLARTMSNSAYLKWFRTRDGKLIPGAEMFEETAIQPVSLRKLAGFHSRLLIQLLQGLRTVCFRDLIADGPEALAERLAERPPVIRLLFGTPALKSSRDIPAVLINEFEFLSGNRHAVFIYTIAKLYPALPTLTTFGPTVPFMFHSPPLIKPMLIVATPIVLAGIYLQYWIMTYLVLRTLALYISFTDEFVGDDAA